MRSKRDLHNLAYLRRFANEPGQALTRQSIVGQAELGEARELLHIHAHLLHAVAICEEDLEGDL